MDSKKHACKFCKKTFPCGRSLGGHIRSHLIRGNKQPKLLKSGSGPGYELRENPKKTNKATDLNLMGEAKSETEDGSDPNLETRSGFIGGNNSNSSVSEVVEPEEEVAVAMSLIMLSRDVFSSNDSFLQEKNKLKKKKKNREIIQGKCSVLGADVSKKIENLDVSVSGYLQNGSKLKEFEVSANVYASNESKNSVSSAKDSYSCKGMKKMEFEASGHLQNRLKMKESEVSENGFASNDQIMKPSPRRKRKVTNPNNIMSKKMESSNYGCASNDQIELGFDDIGISSELLFKISDKRSKFECTTCNKVFYSYQALGGHKASHKKLNGMVKPESINRHFLESNNQQQPLGEPIKVAQKHECPICFRNFPSGQALGGHKRSHLLASNTTTTTNDINKDIHVIGKSPSSEVREFIDLNLPPTTQEEEEEATIIPTSSSTNNLVGLVMPYWWVESHKHDLLLGLISN